MHGIAFISALLVLLSDFCSCARVCGYVCELPSVSLLGPHVYACLVFLKRVWTAQVSGRSVLLDYDEGKPKQSFKTAEGRSWDRTHKDESGGGGRGRGGRGGMRGRGGRGRGAPFRGGRGRGRD